MRTLALLLVLGIVVNLTGGEAGRRGGGGWAVRQLSGRAVGRSGSLSGGEALKLKLKKDSNSNSNVPLP